MNPKRKGLAFLASCFPGFWGKQLNNPIFLIGCARSGTTLLSELLGSHPEVANWSELNDIWDPQGYPWHASTYETPPVWANPTAYTSRWWRDTEPRTEQLRALFGLYQWLRRRPYFLNKTPLNTFRIPYLLTMFPTARFIHLIRDGRAVVFSYTHKQLEKINAYPEPYQAIGLASSFDELAHRLAKFWKANLAEVEQQDAKLGLSKRSLLLEVTYEDLCADTVTVLDRICDYLGLAPGQLSLAARQMALENQNYKWQRGFPAELAASLTEAMEPMLSQKGYL